MNVIDMAVLKPETDLACPATAVLKKGEGFTLEAPEELENE